MNCRSCPRTGTSIRAILLDDAPFADPTNLFIQPDHYVTRLLHAGGVGLDRARGGGGAVTGGAFAAAWRLLCANWRVLRGTPVRYWFDSELAEIFGVRERPSADNADALYDQIAGQLAGPDTGRGRCCARFGIEVLATTDDPADDLEVHAAAPRRSDIGDSHHPTFRPDRYLEPARPGGGTR